MTDIQEQYDDYLAEALIRGATYALLGHPSLSPRHIREDMLMCERLFLFVRPNANEKEKKNALGRARQAWFRGMRFTSLVDEEILKAAKPRYTIDQQRFSLQVYP